MKPTLVYGPVSPQLLKSCSTPDIEQRPVHDTFSMVGEKSELQFALKSNFTARGMVRYIQSTLWHSMQFQIPLAVVLSPAWLPLT
jgi:hypothetical protein